MLLAWQRDTIISIYSFDLPLDFPALPVPESGHKILVVGWLAIFYCSAKSIKLWHNISTVGDWVRHHEVVTRSNRNYVRMYLSSLHPPPPDRYWKIKIATEGVQIPKLQFQDHLISAGCRRKEQRQTSFPAKFMTSDPNFQNKNRKRTLLIAFSRGK